MINHPSVFAAGDIVEWEEEKQYAKTVGQAAVVAKNITSYLANKPLKKQYSGSPEIIILANGKVWISVSPHVHVSDLRMALKPVIRRRLLAISAGASFRPMVGPNDQVKIASTWICAL